MQNLAQEKEFDLHENKHVGARHFHINGFARRLALTQRQKAIRKWSTHIADAKQILCSLVLIG